MAESEAWRDAALAAYRAGRSALDQWKDASRDEVQFYIEELAEALLDLKQATLADDSRRAMKQVDEVTLLIAELGGLAGE